MKNGMKGERWCHHRFYCYEQAPSANTTYHTDLSLVNLWSPHPDSFNPCERCYPTSTAPPPKKKTDKREKKNRKEKILVSLKKIFLILNLIYKK